MTKLEKAKIILGEIDQYVQVNHHFEDYYLKAIIRGLAKIDYQEEDENKKPTQGDV